MKKGEVLKRLDKVTEMTEEEISMNARWIRELATAAYALLKNKETK